MKPDYAKWKPPFRYDSYAAVLRNSDDSFIMVVHRFCSGIDEIAALGQRIAELLNKDAEEKEPS